VEVVDPDVVIYAAVEYGHEKALHEVVRSNVLIPIAFAEALAQKSERYFINVDTFYSKFEGYSHLSAYTLSKKQAKSYLALISKTLSVINMQLEHVYGPGDGAQKAITALAQRMVNDEAEIDLTAGEQGRDFVHVSDVVQAFEVVLKSVDQFPRGVTTIEVGTGESIPLRELLTKLRDVAGSSTELRFGKLPYREGEPMNSKADITKLLALGYQPRVELLEGLRSVVSVLGAAGSK
jgi:nucleoside-diphosphate-sugar epimerase